MRFSTEWDLGANIKIQIDYFKDYAQPFTLIQTRQKFSQCDALKNNLLAINLSCTFPNDIS